MYKPSPEQPTILWNSISSLGSEISDYQNNIFHSQPEFFDPGTAEENQIVNPGTAEENQIVNSGTAEENQIVNSGTGEENQIVNPGTAEGNHIVNPGTAEMNQIGNLETPKENQIVNLGTVTAGENQVFDLGTEAANQIVKPGTAEKNQTVSLEADRENHTVNLEAGEDNQIVTLGTWTFQDYKINDLGTAEEIQIVDLGTAQNNHIVKPGTAQNNQIVNPGTAEEIKSVIPERMTIQNNLIFDSEAGFSEENEKPFLSHENDQSNYGIQSEANIPEYQPIYQLIFKENPPPGKHTADSPSESNALKTSSKVVDDFHKHLPIYNVPVNSNHGEPNLLLSSDQLYPHNHLDHESSNNGFILMGRFLFKMFIKYFEF